MDMGDVGLRFEAGCHKQCFNNCTRSSVSTIEGSGDTTIPSPRVATKQPLPGIGLHDPLHVRHACPDILCC